MRYDMLLSSDIGRLTENKIKKIVHNLENLGHALLDVKAGVGSGTIDVTNYNQKAKILTMEEMSDKILKAFQTAHFVKVYTYYYDIYARLFFEIINDSNLNVSFYVGDNWKYNWDRFPDNGRSARVLLDIIEPFVLKDFDISGEYAQLPEKIPQNCIALYSDRLIFGRGMLDAILLNKFRIKLDLERANFLDVDEILKLKSACDLITLYLVKDEIKVKLAIEKKLILLYPLVPYKMKKFEDEEGMNLQYYIRLAVAIFDFFEFWELKTNFK